jgi:hypothetical protein
MPKPKVVKTKISSDDFMAIAKVMAEKSNGKIRIAHNEKDDSTDKEPEAAHFIKLNEKRISRDIELYRLMISVSEHQALADFIDPILAIKIDCPESFQEAASMLQELGKKVFTDTLLIDWNSLFSELGTREN